MLATPPRADGSICPEAGSGCTQQQSQNAETTHIIPAFHQLQVLLYCIRSLLFFWISGMLNCECCESVVLRNENEQSQCRRHIREVIYAAKRAGATKILKAGGAQAIVGSPRRQTCPGLAVATGQMYGSFMIILYTCVVCGVLWILFWFRLETRSDISTKFDMIEYSTSGSPAFCNQRVCTVRPQEKSLTFFSIVPQFVQNYFLGSCCQLLSNLSMNPCLFDDFSSAEAAMAFGTKSCPKAPCWHGHGPGGQKRGAMCLHIIWRWLLTGAQDHRSRQPVRDCSKDDASGKRWGPAHTFSRDVISLMFLDFVVSCLGPIRWFTATLKGLGKPKEMSFIVWSVKHWSSDRLPCPLTCQLAHQSSFAMASKCWIRLSLWWAPKFTKVQ